MVAGIYYIRAEANALPHEGAGSYDTSCMPVV